MAGQTTLQETLDAATTAGQLYEPLADGAVRCVACGHRCLIKPGRRGICQVRYNEAGVLRVPFGYAGGLQSDPVEKKPFFHILPGSKALTFGMLGCDFHCPYCQNWVSSQALRDQAAGVNPVYFSPDRLLDIARQTDARLIVSSYNEPLITAEWAAAVFAPARVAGFTTAFVSNGNATPEALTYLKPHTDGYKVDLKSMRQKNYRRLGGQLKHVLWTIENLPQYGFWLEVVTLVIPGFNDSDEELRDAARFLAGVSPDIPWHVTGFHQDYKMTTPDNTPVSTLVRAAEIGAEAGLHFVYAGNRPGQVGRWENTLCPHCQTLLIERHGYLILGYHLTDAGRCPHCQQSVPGIWPKSARSVPTDRPTDFFRRRPDRITL